MRFEMTLSTIPTLLLLSTVSSLPINFMTPIQAGEIASTALFHAESPASHSVTSLKGAVELGSIGAMHDSVLLPTTFKTGPSAAQLLMPSKPIGSLGHSIHLDRASVAHDISSIPVTFKPATFQTGPSAQFLMPKSLQGRPRMSSNVATADQFGTFDMQPKSSRSERLENRGVFKDAAVNSVKGVMDAADELGRAAQSTVKGFQDATQKTVQGVQKSVKDTQEATLKTIKDAQDATQKTVMSVQDAARSSVKGVQDAVKSAQLAAGSTVKGVQETIKDAQDLKSLFDPPPPPVYSHNILLKINEMRPRPIRRLGSITENAIASRTADMLLANELKALPEQTKGHVKDFIENNAKNLFDALCRGKNHQSPKMRQLAAWSQQRISHINNDVSPLLVNGVINTLCYSKRLPI